MNNLAITLILFIQFSLAHAYIPTSEHVLEKNVKTHGKGVFQVEYEVILRSGSEIQSLREEWVIKDGDKMYLKVTGKPSLSAGGSFNGDGAAGGTLPSAIKLEFSYLNNKAYYYENGQQMSKKLGQESLERFFHIRSARSLADLLLNSKLVAHDPLKSPPRPKASSQFKHEIDPYLSLARVGEDACVLISTTLEKKEGNSAPGICFEQDTFFIRRIKFPTQTEVQASFYQTLSQEISLPRSRVITWPSGTAEIRLIKLTALGTNNKKIEESLPPNSYASENLSWGHQSALTALVKEFYERFR